MKQETLRIDQCGDSTGRLRLPINPYWYKEHFTHRPQRVIGEILEALRSADYYDKSDAQVDYFDTAYYFHLNVGDWDKPYNLEAK